jgi:alkyl sulfatase BDS1-like metallo-beta-lactamase superfamily hydrolase
VKIPVSDKPYLRPVYDRPEFIVRNLIRRYGGWWNGRPADLMPAPDEARAKEIVSLAGGVGAVVARARELAATDLPLACHLAEWAATAAPDDAGAQECVRDVFTQRMEAEDSLMGRGIYGHAVRRAGKVLGG